MELAYRLAVGRLAAHQADPRSGDRLDPPVADPDGRDRNVDWYYKYGINETEGRTTGAGVPYWGKYVFHDDNRDINYSQVEMRALLDWYLQWHPPIMHDLHQAQTLLYTFSGQAPQNPNLDPILYGELPMMANFEMSQMAKYGMPGVWTHGFVDMWSPGYLAFMSSNHNGMIRMYEIQGTSGANTTKVRLGNPNGTGANGAAVAPTGRRRAARPDAGGDRPPGAATRRCANGSVRGRRPASSTGRCATTRTTARPACSPRSSTRRAFPKIILENFYIKSKNSIETGRKETVAGYVIPVGPARHDPGRTAGQPAAPAGDRSRTCHSLK